MNHVEKQAEEHKPKTAKFIVNIWAQSSFTQNPEIQQDMKRSVFLRGIFQGTVQCARCKQKPVQFHLPHELEAYMIKHRSECEETDYE